MGVYPPRQDGVQPCLRRNTRARVWRLMQSAILAGPRINSTRSMPSSPHTERRSSPSWRRTPEPRPMSTSAMRERRMRRSPSMTSLSSSTRRSSFRPCGRQKRRRIATAQTTERTVPGCGGKLRALAITPASTISAANTSPTGHACERALQRSSPPAALRGDSRIPSRYGTAVHRRCARASSCARRGGFSDNEPSRRLRGCRRCSWRGRFRTS